MTKSASDSHGPTLGPMRNNDDPPQDAPLSRLVRRVQAVIRVKSEDNEDLGFQTSPSDTGSPFDDDCESAPVVRRRPGVGSRKNNQMLHNGQDERPDPDASQRASLYRKKNRGFESDGDDELMLGGEVCTSSALSFHS